MRSKVGFSGGWENNHEIESCCFHEIKSFYNIWQFWSGGWQF